MANIHHTVALKSYLCCHQILNTEKHCSWNTQEKYVFSRKTHMALVYLKYSLFTELLSFVEFDSHIHCIENSSTFVFHGRKKLD